MKFKEEVKPVISKLNRIWKAVNEFREYIEENKLRDSKGTLTSLIYILSDFEVSLATDYQRIFKDLDEEFVFNTICQEKSV